ncbi:hypothetical protein AB0B27_14245 [Micromonospora rifamycinica]|uniref:tetratricopeptide repeat protein n=1 Tax=Micromonospora rifamycinica TaxID=291594 RepID=UPI0033E6647C
MDADESRPEIRRSRALEKAELPAGPLRDLRDAVYLLYAEADRPRLDTLARQIADDNDLPGAPKKDLISKIIAGGGLASQQDTVTVAVALARAARRVDAATVAGHVRQMWITAATAAPTVPVVRLGRPVAECDPLALEVHPAIEVGGGEAGELPGYVSRAHDVRLREVADGLTADGRSRLAVLVGGSSTGKTRACWELVRYLDRREPGRWQVWHPYDPTRPGAALADLDRVGPDTVVWLNEAQHYLMPADAETAERVAARLRSLLHDQVRAPVLVLATLWPEYWHTLTTRLPIGAVDVHAQARELLTGTVLSTSLTLPDAFTPAEVATLDGAGGDARLRHAARRAEHGRITQYLAGAPALEDRYRTAPPAARALLQVAMDARRLGHPLALSHALLEQAAPGYLDDHDWDNLGEDWLEQALAYTTTPCTGARGPLTRIRPRAHPVPAVPECQVRYRLADYLEQLGRTERVDVYPPDSLWQAFASTITDPGLQRDLGSQAERRGRYHHAIHLYRQAADGGDAVASGRLAELRGRAGDLVGAETPALRAVDCGNPYPLRHLVELRARNGDLAGAGALALQAADRGYTEALMCLAGLQDWAGDAAGAEALYRQAADRGDADAIGLLAVLRARAGDLAGAEVLYRQAIHRSYTDMLRWMDLLRARAGAEALHSQADDRDAIVAVERLVELRAQAGDLAGAEALALQAVDRGEIEALRRLAEMREEDGDPAGAKALVTLAADRGHAGPLGWLASLRARAGDAASAEALYRRAADCGDITAVGQLAVLRARAGDLADAEALALQAADRGDTNPLRRLIELREQVGDLAGVEALAWQAADRGDTHGLGRLAELRERAGDAAGAEALYRQIADRGHGSDALGRLAELREQAGDPAGADLLRRFGLTGAGDIATGLPPEIRTP